MAIIEIGSTKQLFVDDYLIESLTNAKQGLNQAVKADYNPILRPERPWEGNYMRPSKVIFDEKDQNFKMWYTASTTTVRLENGKPVAGGPAGLVLDSRGSVTCLATSEDGVHWERPSLGLVEFDGSTDNNILPKRENLPTVPAFQDLHEKDPAKLYKALRMRRERAGRQVDVEILIQHLVAGDSLDKFLDDFPTVSREQAVAYLKMMLEVADARVA